MAHRSIHHPLPFDSMIQVGRRFNHASGLLLLWSFDASDFAVARRLYPTDP